ncbi:MAG: branched-chain amino acid ABC transporter permease [Acidimicrobiia bacterium]|nr:branched-chain amino acid ABC transporter permease [Acidimicrobiia bacterium]
MLGSFTNEILATVGLFLLMGLGLNIVIGLAGLLDLGYVAFFAVGAYAVAVLTSPSSPKFDATWPFILAIPAVILAAAFAGVMVGTPVIRMRGDYLAIVTLGFGEIARILFISDWLKPTFGGAQGILSIPSLAVWRWVISLTLLVAAVMVARFSWQRLIRPGIEPAPSPRLRAAAAGVAALIAVGSVVAATKIGIDGTFIVQGTQPKLVFYAVFFFAIIAAFISWRLQDSRVGRAWMAMREDEQVAEAMGINTTTAKLMAFITGAILASFGGALFAAKIGSVFPNSFALIVSIIVLVLIIVGGMGNIPGVAVGALVLVGILGGPTQPGLLREFEGFKLLIYGALLIYMMLKRPEGLLPSSRRAQELHQEEVMQDAWLKGEAGQAETEPAT